MGVICLCEIGCGLSMHTYGMNIHVYVHGYMRMYVHVCIHSYGEFLLIHCVPFSKDIENKQV